MATLVTGFVDIVKEMVDWNGFEFCLTGYAHLVYIVIKFPE